jgi:hypothetical protein
MAGFLHTPKHIAKIDTIKDQRPPRLKYKQNMVLTWEVEEARHTRASVPPPTPTPTHMHPMPLISDIR